MFFCWKFNSVVGDYLNEFVKLCARRDSVRQLLGKAAIDDDNGKCFLSSLYFQVCVVTAFIELLASSFSLFFNAAFILSGFLRLKFSVHLSVTQKVIMA